MENSSKNINFDEVAKVITLNFEEHTKVIHKCCVKSSIIPLADYYDALQKEYKTIESCTTPRKDKPDPLEYIDLFKAFDEYPTNLPKPKKQTARENARLHSTMKSSKTNSSSVSINSSKLVDDQPSAAVICKEFSKFSEKLANFKKELAEQSCSKEYNEKLENINTFARELDKLSLSEETGNDAFTEEEEAKIKQISKNMEHFAFIQENQDLYSNSTPTEASPGRLNDLVDIVTDALVAVNCYKP
ncbi:augmin complex subunit msd5 [Episyrphus balteatus]|uniref:augmin complex subunit msd5 n=1 Tax=Episyrphus balteatus TaxID=286459 RepID=UPI0024864AF7|nr:augmin complex subunit msd5 [Episyrphus balteatus]